MLQAVERERQSLRDREAEWRERLDRLDGNRARAEAEAARQEEAAREATEAGVALRRELDQVREQVGIATRDVPGDVRALVVDLLSLPDVQLLPLTPGSPREWMRGHLIWHAGRASGVVYAFGLPPLPSGTFYRARVLVDGGWIENGMAFRPSPRGDVVLPLPIAGLAGQLRGLEIVGEPDGRTVLRGAVDEVEK